MVLYVGIGTIIHFHSRREYRALLLLLAILGCAVDDRVGLTIAAGVSPAKRSSADC